MFNLVSNPEPVNTVGALLSIAFFAGFVILYQSQSDTIVGFKKEEEEG